MIPDDPVSLLLDTLIRLINSCAATLQVGDADWPSVCRKHGAVRCSVVPPSAPPFMTVVSEALAYLVARGADGGQATPMVGEVGDLLWQAFHWSPVAPNWAQTAPPQTFDVPDAFRHYRDNCRAAGESLRALSAIQGRAMAAVQRLQLLAASVGLVVRFPAWEPTSEPRPALAAVAAAPRAEQAGTATDTPAQSGPEQVRDAIQDLLFFSVHRHSQEAVGSAAAAIRAIRVADIAPPGCNKETWLHQLKVDAFKLYCHVTTGQLTPQELDRLKAAMRERQDELWAMSPNPSPAAPASKQAQAVLSSLDPTPEQRTMEPNPFRELCNAALQIREQECERDRTPLHQRRQRPLEERAALEARLGELVADCWLAGKRLGEGREREAEEAARQLADACKDLLVWEAAVRLGRLSPEESVTEKGGPCIALCNRLGPSFDHLDHLARLYERTRPSGTSSGASAPPPVSPPPDRPVAEGEEEDPTGLPPYAVEEQPWHGPLSVLKEVGTQELLSLADTMDVVLITATPPELNAVLRRLEPYPRRRAVLKGFVGPETYYLGRFGSCLAAVTKCRMGSLEPGSATLATQHAQRVWRPRAVIMVGIALGHDPKKQKIADVLVASQIISYEQQRVGEKEVIHRGAIPPTNPTLLNRFENAPHWSFPRPDGSLCRCLVGPLLSGEKLVDDPAFKASLFERYPQAIGGEMEGVGLAAVAVRDGIPWIVVKAICDWADGKKHKKHQPLAAAAAVSLAHHVLSQKDVLHGLKKPNPER